MPEPLRCALLGTGHAHAAGKLRVLQASPEWEVVGVCEPFPEFRERARGNPAYREVRWLSQDDLLGDPTIKMVAIESHVEPNLALAQAAIDAGKHIHLDKPAGTSLSAFEALLETATKRHLIVQLGYMFRYNQGFDFIRRALREGWLGDVHAVTGSINSPLGTPEHRRFLGFHPGGILFELGCHLIDMLVIQLGKPRHVHPHLRSDGPYQDGFTDNTHTVFEYEKAVAHLSCSQLEVEPSSRRRWEVMGDNGTITLQPLEPPSLRLCLKEPRGGFAAGWQAVEVPWTPRYILDLQDLAACIRGERPFAYSPQHDLDVQETLLRACDTLR